MLNPVHQTLNVFLIQAYQQIITRATTVLMKVEAATSNLCSDSAGHVAGIIPVDEQLGNFSCYSDIFFFRNRLVMKILVHF